MKFRIVERENGTYDVERKDGLLLGWERDVFNIMTLDSAKDYVENELVRLRKKKKLKKIIRVVKVWKV